MATGRLSSTRELEADLERLSAGGFVQCPFAVAREELGLLTPPEDISTAVCAATHRYIPVAEGSGARLYSLTLTPYTLGPQDAMDDPMTRTVIVVGPGRTGKTIIGENHLFKRLRHGPLTDTLIYLPGETDVDSYADTTFASFFDLHPEIRAKVGKKPSDNKRTFKRIAGRYVEILPANGNTVRGRQAPYIMATEIDGFRKTLVDNFKQQTDIRGRAYGNRRKAYLESHPDRGWAGGIAAAWKESTRGIWYWPCPQCGDWSSPCPTAEWRMKLDYERPQGMADDDLLDHVEKTACMVCPHCGRPIEEDEKAGMLAAGIWVFEGQTIAPDGTVSGTVKPNETAGFWIHGTMSPFVTWGKLAREYVGALIFFEKTRKPHRLREVTAKSLGECFEGGDGTNRALDVARLKRRAEEQAPVAHQLGTVPAGVRFITKSVDVGGGKFDILVKGWDEQGQLWIIDRYTRTAGPDGKKLAPGLRQKDWLVLKDELAKVYPLADRPGWGLPVASMAVDTGGVPGVAWKAREFARQMKLGPCAGANGYRLRLIKGAASKKAPEIGNGREVNRDDQGRKIEPPITEYDLGVHELKKVVAEYLATEAPGPGYVNYPDGFEQQYLAELTNEKLIDEEWVRQGANETFDLMVYGEATRRMLKPERPTIRWDDAPPPWARPVPMPGAEPATAPTAAAPKKQSMFDRFDALNRSS